MLKMLSIILFSFSIFAQEIPCVDKLTKNNTLTSSHFQLQASLGNFDLDEDLNLELAKKAVTLLLRTKLYCKAGEIEYTGNENCSFILSSKPLSQLCYLEVNKGHFLVSKDSESNMNLIFNYIK